MSETYAEQIDRHRVTRRRKLLSAAAEALADLGIRQATMEQIAAKVGVSKVILYRYFGAKDKLVHAVLEEVVDDFLEADEEDAEWWTDRVRRTLRVARANPAGLKLLVRHAAHDPEFGLHLDRLVDALVARAAERVTEIRGPEQHTLADTRFLAQTIMAFFLDSYVRWIDDGPSDRDDEFLEWVTRSVRALSYYWAGENPPSI